MITTRIGPIELKPDTRGVMLRGEHVSLTANEYALLKALAVEPTRVYTKEELIQIVWGFRSLGSTKTLDKTAQQLRHKLNKYGDRLIVNVWGVGYRLTDQVTA